MGIGALVLATISWAAIVVGATLISPHMLASVALVFAISGWAVAHERRRLGLDGASPPKRFDIWLNLAAVAVSIACIMIDVMRHAHA